MGHWYEESFGYEYLELYAHRDAAEARADIEAIVRLLDPPRDAPLLDLCCGACRHLMILHEMGFSKLVGLDLSAELLDVAGRQMGACPIELVRSDMRQIPYQDYFATVLSLFTSFGYFEQDHENQAVFQSVYRALRPGGQFLIDYMNRDYVLAHLVPEDERILADRHIRNLRCLTPDCRRVEKTTIVTIGGGQTTADGAGGASGGPRRREFHESVRLYSHDEMVDMLRAVGFVDVTSWGALDGTPYCSGSRGAGVCAQNAEWCSKRLILIARKNGSEGHTCAP